MKLDKPTIIAVLVYLSTMLAIVGGVLAKTITLADGITKAQYVTMAMLPALGIISHGTPSQEQLDIARKAAEQPKGEVLTTAAIAPATAPIPLTAAAVDPPSPPPPPAAA